MLADKIFRVAWIWGNRKNAHPDISKADAEKMAEVRTVTDGERTLEKLFGRWTLLKPRIEILLS